MKIGDTYNCPFMAGRPKCHVRGKVDGQLVVRYWWTSKKRWEYKVEDPTILKMFLDEDPAPEPRVENPNDLDQGPSTP